MRKRVLSQDTQRCICTQCEPMESFASVKPEAPVIQKQESKVPETFEEEEEENCFAETYQGQMCAMDADSRIDTFGANHRCLRFCQEHRADAIERLILVMMTGTVTQNDNVFRPLMCEITDVDDGTVLAGLQSGFYFESQMSVLTDVFRRRLRLPPLLFLDFLFQPPMEAVASEPTKVSWQGVIVPIESVPTALADGRWLFRFHISEL